MYSRYYGRGREGEVEGKKRDVLHSVTYPRYTQMEVKKKSTWNNDHMSCLVPPISMSRVLTSRVFDSRCSDVGCRAGCIPNEIRRKIVIILEIVSAISSA
jgi:hypothetical protein